MLDAGSQPGASKIQTADDCCNACRQNSQVSMHFVACILWHRHATYASQPQHYSGNSVLLKQTGNCVAMLITHDAV